MLHKLVLAAGSATSALTEAITPEEGLELLTAHLHRARSIAARLQRSTRTARKPIGSGRLSLASLPVPRPGRVLLEQNRGRIFPQLLNAEPAHRPGTPVQEALAALGRVRWDMSPHAALDLFVGSSGLPWEVAAGLLHRRGLIPAAFSAPDINAIRDARAFWDGYCDGRAAFQAGVAAGDFTALAGDWAFFEAAQLSTLLLGFCLPRALQRDCYLTCLQRDPSGLCLDIHAAPSGLALLRHPF